MTDINLQDIKQQGVFIGILDGVGSLYKLNDRTFAIGKHGFHEI